MRTSSAGRLWQDEQGRWKAKRFIIDLISLALLTLLFRWTLASALAGDASCANTGGSAYQPQVSEVASALAAAATHSLGSNYKDPGNIWVGIGSDQQFVPATFPCTILKSIGYVESTWHQADSSVARGSSGAPLVSPDCGYGIMQITSPMTSPGLIDTSEQARIAGDFRYNISYGAYMLASKWNNTPIIGNNNPSMMEDWYFAVWAYNGWSWKNNPNNPAYDPNRSPYTDGASRSAYPYQEIVWGLAASPPSIGGSLAWSPAPIALPPSSQIGNPPGSIADPQPTHTDACAISPPPTATPTPTVTPTPTATPLPLLQATTSYMGFLAEPGGTPGPQTLTLTGNRSSIGWSISKPSWVTAVPTGGSSLPANLNISVAPLSTPGSRSGSMSIVNTDPYANQSNLIIGVYEYLGTLRRLRFPLVYK